jgi:hypothetical protein
MYFVQKSKGTGFDHLSIAYTWDDRKSNELYFLSKAQGAWPDPVVDLFLEDTRDPAFWSEFSLAFLSHAYLCEVTVLMIVKTLSGIIQPSKVFIELIYPTTSSD